jgi:hypothetical protein
MKKTFARLPKVDPDSPAAQRKHSLIGSDGQNKKGTLAGALKEIAV